MKEMLNKTMHIHHSVAFNLKYTRGSKQENDFLEACWNQLSVIPGVLNFKINLQISPKNPYAFELEMDFKSQEEYDAYNEHPNHFDKKTNTGFVPERWLNEVVDFLEKDTVEIERKQMNETN